MGLTKSSTGMRLAKNDLLIKCIENENKVIGLAGNPNVGKSTIFNNLTGMKQHTGNWPGKTVSSAVGTVNFNGQKYSLVDLPGTYSLLTHSKEEDVARDFICFGRAEKIIVVCDASCLERNLNLCLQIIEMNENVLVCVNLIDVAKRKGINVNIKKLSEILGVPVVGVVGNKKKTLYRLSEKIEDKSKGKREIVYPTVVEECASILQKTLEKYRCLNFSLKWLAVNLITNKEEITEKIKTYYDIDLDGDENIVSALKEAEKIMERYGIDREKFSDKIARNIVSEAEKIASEVVTQTSHSDRERKIDEILTGRFTAVPLMLLMLFVVFWITITGANYPSEFMNNIFLSLEKPISEILNKIYLPEKVIEIFVSGVYRVLTWVISVMLPPMAIFFPLFTLLEDLGYLPRVAFNLDNAFRKANSCGKQALTICMGFGCNAAGVTGGRIIDSERERLTAILTNSFVPCNGRFPMLISIISIFFVTTSVFSGLFSSALLSVVICFGILMTMAASKFLSKIFLKGVPSSFALELPPFRKPQFGKIIIRSVFDRTLFVLGRAVMVAAPAGLLIWLMANIEVGNVSLFKTCTDFLEPVGKFIGLDGVILFAFILGFPANEIVIPLTVMGYTFGTELRQVSSTGFLAEILTSNGWTAVTAICFIVFTLLHWPCSTTCITIYKETKSIKWTILGFVLPTACGMIICCVINMLAKVFIGN